VAGRDLMEVAWDTDTPMLRPRTTSLSSQLGGGAGFGGRRVGTGGGVTTFALKLALERRQMASLAESGAVLKTGDGRHWASSGWRNSRYKGLDEEPFLFLGVGSGGAASRPSTAAARTRRGTRTAKGRVPAAGHTGARQRLRLHLLNGLSIVRRLPARGAPSQLARAKRSASTASTFSRSFAADVAATRPKAARPTGDALDGYAPIDE
jgi:hypothetical protein